MSESINLTLLIGNLADKPKELPRNDGTIAVTARLATNESWRDRQTGEQKEITDWHSLIAEGRTGEVLVQFGEKGKRVFIRGEKRESQYTDRAGVEHRDAEIRVLEVRFLSARGTRKQEDGPERSAAPPNAAPGPSPAPSPAAVPAAPPVSHADPHERDSKTAAPAESSTEMSGDF